jgi:hypothetical protein
LDVAASFAGREISGEEGSNRLAPSSIMLKLHFAESCVDIVIRVFPVTSTSRMLRVWVSEFQMLLTSA